MWSVPAAIGAGALRFNVKRPNAEVGIGAFGKGKGAMSLSVPEKHDAS